MIFYYTYCHMSPPPRRCYRKLARVYYNFLQLNESCLTLLLLVLLCSGDCSSHQEVHLPPAWTSYDLHLSSANLGHCPTYGQPSDGLQRHTAVRTYSTFWCSLGGSNFRRQLKYFINFNDIIIELYLIFV